MTPPVFAGGVLEVGNGAIVSDKLWQRVKYLVGVAHPAEASFVVSSITYSLFKFK
jgi:hypothetical protein